MPQIFDNIDHQLLPALRTTLSVSHRSDFCVGYFNLRGWRQLDEQIEKWAGGDGECCRLLVGMQTLPQQEIAGAYGIIKQDAELDNQTAIRLKKALAEQFRTQLTLGAPTDADEIGLRRLAKQIRAKQVIVKLHLRHPLHAKLYLLFRHDPVSPVNGFLGSSNLTFAGLSKQGELNVDVTDHDACEKLAKWFNDRWSDKWCLDISSEIADIIDSSWARPEPIPPHHIYVKMAYHLSQEAREGIVRYGIPKDFGDQLFEFQEKAVKIAAHHVQKRGGVLLADVVGLGKTLMATALARVLADELMLETLILCPLNLVKMWEDYCHTYRVPSCKVLSYSKVLQQLPDLRRYRLIIMDESHNLRNREIKTYRVISEYIQKNDSKCILLTATPYNKDYFDLASQLRLFVPPDRELGVGPERLFQEVDRAQFRGKFQCGANTLAAFEKSQYPDDWRDLMRLYMVRRTRGFIKANYAKTDLDNGRKYLEFKDGTRSYFPDRLPKRLPFVVDENDPNDEYAKLYSSPVVDIVNHLSLPRYGLGNSLLEKPTITASKADEAILANLSAAGTRLMGFCRSNLFKRLESSGHSFLLSVERHILRNFIFLHAIESGLDIPIGTQDSGLLDTSTSDEDTMAQETFDEINPAQKHLRSLSDFRTRAAEVYALYVNSYRSRFQWIRPGFFKPRLQSDLLTDAKALMQIFERCAVWNPQKDSKLQALLKLVSQKHKTEKVLVFSQFSDTVYYLNHQLTAAGIKRTAAATGDSENVTDLAYRFSPQSNKKTIAPDQELRVLVATDVLSEGQNLQDAFIIVNFDLPWTIIRLYYIWDPRIHAKLYHSAEQNRKLGGFTLSQGKAIQRARKEHETYRAEFESILRGIEGSMEAANLGSRRLTTQELFEALKHAQHPTRRDHRSYVPPEEMVEYQSARYQAAEANILNETESYLDIDGYLYGVVSLKELPDATFPGMLQNFSTLGFPIVVSGQVVIPDQVKVLKSYKKRLQKMTAAQKDANGNFKSNPEAEVAQAQLMQVQRDIISSSLKTAKLSLSMVVRTSRAAVTMRDLEQSERELANRTQEVLNAFTHMNGAKAVAETIAKRRIFLGTLPGLGEADKRDQDMLTSNVADLVPVEMPWMGTRRSPLILFETPFRQLIPFSMFDPDLSDANGLLMAKSGGGKTLAAQQMLLMAARANPLISILERGDSYQPLVELMGGEMIEMSLDSDQTINPWDLPKGEDRPSNDQISAHAGIFDVFDELFGTIQSDIGSSLKSIYQLSQQVQQLYQTTMWPLAALNQARGFVANSITAFRSQMNQIFSTQFTSAVTAGPQQFESILHSRLSAQIPALGASFTANYGSLPQQNSAAPQDLLMMDMDDALGQENLKTTLIADQGADTILQTANQMENQVATTTPGSNPYLTAQAQVSNLRCQAYLQKMLAAQLRQEAGRIAHDNALLKRRTTITGGINSLITGALTAH